MHILSHNKTEFLNSIEEKYKQHYISFFRKFDKMEHSINKDLVEMNREELEQTLSELEYSFITQLARYKTYLIQYFKFHNNTMMNDYSLDILKSLCKFENKTLTYECIKRMEKEINQIDNGWYYNSIIFCTFYGFRITECRDLIDIRKSHISNNKISFSDGFQISLANKPELKKYLNLVIDYDCQYSTSPASRDKEYEGLFADSIFKVQTQDSTTNIRESLKLSFRRNAIGKIKRVTDNKDISLSVIYDSGLFHFVQKQIDLSGGKLEDYLRAPRNDYKNVFLKQCLSEFGTSMTLEVFKLRAKERI